VTWDVAVAGTFHSDDLTTPAGRRDALGGSAVYFSLAASRYTQVHVNGIVGEDTAGEYRRILGRPSIHLDGMVVSSAPTFRWHAVHDFDRWVTSHESSEPGCDPLWEATLSPQSRSADVLFVGSMAPALQHKVIDQSSAELIGLDSMTEFIEAQREPVAEVLRHIDILFLTGTELAAFTGSDDWRESAARLCGAGRLRAVVVKHGPGGAACVTADTIVEMPALAVPAVADPTGAGDALAGGFLGYVAQTMQTDDAVFAQALSEGLARAAEAIVAFGTAGLAATGTV
jgi:sugar/nucleoside kinase (ribokinase family)